MPAYGRVQSVKLLPRGAKEEAGESAMACTVAFMDIKSASKAHNAEHKIDDRTLTTEYYEPAAIPSAASPQNTPSSYSTSPGSTRFPNGHGSTEEHANFGDRFYERPNNRVTEGEFIRRTNYHDNCRGRNRERSYRNGPYNAIMDRSHRTLNNSWSYDSTRYNSQNETGYVSTPSDSNERRSSDQSTKKKAKSRSGSRSPSPSGSTSSRSPSRSRSRSSSSSSSSSTSRDTSSSSEKRPVAIRVKNLPPRSSDTSLKDGLFHEYKKHGKVTWVKVVGQGSERYAIVCFKKPEDVEKALEVSYDKLFFGCKIEVEPYQGYDVEDNDLRPYEAEIDEFHPKATRTLFIGNLEKDVTASDLRKHFDLFGEIIEIDIKKQGAVGSYAFCQYSDIVSVVKAIRAMDGEHLGNNRIKLGFGKSMPTNCVWVDGVVDVNEKYLRIHFEPFGSISKVHVDRDKGQALIFYEQVVGAQLAVNKMRGFSVKGSKIQVDFASRECQESFFEHLEKQGTVLDRTGFEERRDSVSRTFDATTNRFSRYDTPTRPRTSSYSSRSSATASQVTSAIPSPGTPGSVTPRGSGSRSRIARFAEYYDQTGEYGPERHFRNYDEYSQGSAASHEDGYEHEYPYNSPTHTEPVETRTAPAVVADHTNTSFVQPDIRNLQKERVHLLEQLEECPSSGDELISPKKRLKLDLLENSTTSDVIIEANRDHRKVMEVRRLSDPNVKHHSRRPSVDNKHTRDVTHDRGNTYLPHPICKRRKTAGSDSGSRTHHYDHSGSESVGGSRPGTPLVDERPEHFTPSEPRRIPREREGPLTLPLPRFAAQVLNRGSVSVAGIKGQKDNVLSSPPPAVTSPRISNPKPPSPVHVPPPASPPPRPPSLSSNSSDSDITPPSPSLDERIRSLVEKYEKWSGSRALSAAGGDALAKSDATREKFRLRHKLLDLDLKEVQPSEIVKSVMAKRSVFDEDLKRLENVGEKYEPKEFSSFQRVVSNVQISIPPLPSSAPPIPTATQLPKTPTMLSPRSAGANVTAAKGLQYPFPSHPPIQLTPPVLHPQAPPGTPTTPTPTTSATLPTLPPASTTSTITRGANHGDNRLKPCTSVSSDNRTSSKVNVNRSGVVSNLAPVKTSDKNSVNIPNASDTNATQSALGNACVPTTDKLTGKTVKTSDKTSDKVTCRRDSNSGSPRGDVKSRRNSDAGVRRVEDNDKYSDSSGDKQEERVKADEKKEHQRLEKARLENERLERERLEKERLEKEKQEKERLEKEKLERERLERESELEKERLEKERLERERLERERRREREERERREREEKERREREEQERQERERRELEEKLKREEEERTERERLEKEKIEKERLERERKRDEEKKHKEDNHDKRKEEHRHRENHSDSKHRDNNHLHDNKNTKEHDSFKKDSHESRSSHEKSRHHIERDAERRKESVKENRDNNVHEKQKNFTNDMRENKIESRHMSIDFDRTKSYDSLNKSEANKRKERNNSLPANVGVKRRLSSHDSVENIDEIKKIKLSQDHKKLSERRDSKDSNRSDEKTKSKHKNNSKVYEDKIKHNNTKESEEKRKDRDDKHKSKQQKTEKHKIKSKSREKECRESPSTPKSPIKELTDKDFLARLDLRSNEEMEKQKQRKENKEKKKLDEEDKKEKEETKKSENRRDKHSIDKCKSREENTTPKSDDKKCQRKDRSRKLTQNSSDNSDSDEPKKHSIFDIVDDEPAYISMYDKVKARSCKNMQKQEEEKRQEKIKAKFSQLKQSRAKREEKKRSTSWDEDSDSDRERSENRLDHKTKRPNKMLIMSSDEEEPTRKSHKKREIYSDSDSERPRQIKSEHNETSEDDRFRSKLQRKGSKSRITSDTSDDEIKKIQNPVKLEIFSDNEVDQGFADSEEKPFKVKDEYNRIIKKSRDKHQDSIVDQMNAQIFGDSNSPVLDIKTERFNNRHSFGENSSGEENIEKKERTEIRKKHKKKQKRQKHSLSSEECNKLETVVDSILTECTEKSKHHDKKKQHSKKDKKRDKSKDERDKSKKSKKNKSDIKSDLKRDGKMENIFGSLSEDSESGIKESEQSDHKSSLFHERFNESNVQSSIYASDSDREPEKIFKCEEKERESKEEHRKRKEKKRREKERRLQEEAAAAEHINENSMDYADMGKQLEANIKDDSMEELVIKSEVDSGHDAAEDSFRFSETSEFHDIKKEDRKEAREKKKKRKKSKEEKQKHHHHHHHDKNKVKSEVKKETSAEEVKTEVEENKSQNQSLPNLLDTTPSPPQNKSSSSLDFSISPIPRESLISPIPKTPTTSKEKKREKFLPGFGGTEIDEKIHENAVKSISEFETPVEVTKKVEEPKTEPVVESTEDKPRVVISQEETEDAVAALLGESFGGGQFEECYNEDDINTTNEQSSNLADDNIVQDDEEMRQAVQSLSAADIDVKPETPQSEHELQIDTDTEEQEETTVRFEQPPKTPEITEPAPTPKTPEISNYYAGEEQKVVVKATPNIGSPPSLTPIKPQAPVPSEIKKPEEPKTASLSLPILPDQSRSVISQAWNIERKEPPKPESPKVTSTTPPVTPTQTKVTAVSLRTYGSPPVVKISEPTYPPLAALTKQEHPQISTVPEQIKLQTYPVLQPNQKSIHNIQVCTPITQKNLPSSSADSPVSMPTKLATSTNLSLSRLPITPIMVSKPLQATTVLLPQAKIAHSLEPPVLVSTSDPRPPQERPRMVFQTAPNATSHFTNIVQSQPRMVVQANVAVSRSLPPQGLLVPARQLPPTSYSYLGNIPATNYGLTPTVTKDNMLAQSDKNDGKIVSTTQNNVKQTIIMSTHSHLSQSNTVNTSKPFMPVIKETPPKLVSIPEVRVSQPTIIQQTTKPQSHVPENVPKEVEKVEPDQLKVSVDVTRTSTPSPVIVQTPPKEPEKKPETLPPTPPPSQNEEPLKQLAIEKVTEELNLTLKKEVVEVKEEKPEIKEEPKTENVEQPSKEVKTETEEPKLETIKQNPTESGSQPVKETDEEKADTESVLSDISKERSSADILTSKDDPLDNKEDSDYWSAKEVNIDSVIKTLCSADELSDHSSETGKDEWLDDSKGEDIKSEDSPKKEEVCDEMTENFDETHENDEKETTPRSGGRRGGRARGRKTRTGSDRSGIQTRRGGKVAKEPVTPSKRGGRGGGRQKGERKLSKSESEITSDVYEFRDDSDENNANKERPRLILTIKSPAAVNPQPVVKEVVKEVIKEPSPKPTETKEEFLSPVANTRKSRRLQERDVLRNTVDDTIEDVVRNTVMVTRSSTNQTARRSARQAAAHKVLPETPRKSPRGNRKKDRRTSDPSEDSSEEKSKIEVETKAESDSVEAEKPKEIEKEEPKVEVKEKPHEGLKVKMLRRVKGDMAQEATNLIDPVTGLLTPMRECEEGRYIPLPKTNENQQKSAIVAPQQQAQSVFQQQHQKQPQQPPVQSPLQQQKPKPQSLKAHVLSSQAAKAVVSQQMPLQPQQQQPQPQQLQQHPPQQQPQTLPVKKSTIIVSQPIPIQQPTVVSKSSTPLSQALNVNVSMATYSIPHASPRSGVPMSVSNKGMPGTKPPMLSPGQMAALSSQQKQLLQVNKQQTSTIVTKSPMVNPIMTNQTQIINTQVAHLKQQPQPIKQAVINKAKPPHNIHQQQILTASVASPPLNKGPMHGLVAGVSQNRIVQGPPHQKGVMEPPKIDVPPNVILGPRSNLSPQGQPRHVTQSGMPVPTYEASLHGDGNSYNFPPPAHQNSPSPQGDAIAHFPPGAVPLRSPHDLPPGHYMHPHVMPYPYMRPQPYHLPRSPMVGGGLEKSGDGQEGEEAPDTLPPFELRRPGSVGLALTGRTAVVPHSLHSPHDRTTDSPQVGQVYNMHTPRMQHYHSTGPGPFYEQTAEPPPAHRSLTSHGSLTALANDRSISHMAALGAPERPMSGHTQPDRPLSSHSALSAHIGSLGTSERPISTHLPDRPLSNHGLAIGAGLGAAGNLMGAVARHMGVDAPTSQRGLQAATPPHASQVPAQAESLFTLLKQYPCMWQGLLALKNDQAAVQMYFVSGNDSVAKCSLPKNTDGSTPPLRIFQRMRLEPPQVEGVARKMQMENEHCMLLALPCGHDHVDVLKQSTNLTSGFITYLQQKQAAGIVNVAAPGTTQPPAYVVHIFPSCDFVNENLRRIAPNLLERVADIAHLLIVITTV
ncbi:protein split ends-like isoform X3 [Zophobas morio]|uniref:protein split ends-like isoform X3 n=1 Tax=Zophobas morio TaxID=2755281 RepID=UPI00308354C7